MSASGTKQTFNYFPFPQYFLPIFRYIGINSYPYGVSVMNKNIPALAGPLEKNKQADLLETFLNSVIDMGGLPCFDSDRPFKHDNNCYMSSGSSARFLIKYF